MKRVLQKIFVKRIFDGPVGIRTRSLPVANGTLYQVELQAHKSPDVEPLSCFV